MYKVAEVAKILNVSRVSVYNKIKALKRDIQPFTRHEKGILLIDDKGFDLLRHEFGFASKEESKPPKVNTMDDNSNILSTPNNFNKDEKTFNNNVYNDEIAADYIKSLKDQVDYLRSELESKNRQLEAKDELLKNFQVLLRDEKRTRLLLEERIEQDHVKTGNIFTRLFSKK